MKKLLALVGVGVLALSLVACGGNKKADGVYTARVDEAYAAESGHGWADELAITYQNGEIADVTFSSFNAEGVNKAEAEDYEMEPAPAEWMPQLAENIKTAGTPDKMDAIAGATNSSTTAKALFEAIVKDGKANETITVTIPAEDAE